MTAVFAVLAISFQIISLLWTPAFPVKDLVHFTRIYGGPSGAQIKVLEHKVTKQIIAAKILNLLTAIFTALAFVLDKQYI